MPNHASAKKRVRQTLRRRKVNQNLNSRLKTLEKNLLEAVKTKDKKKAENHLSTLNKQMDSCSGKGLHHKNKVARKKSRWTALVNAL